MRRCHSLHAARARQPASTRHVTQTAIDHRKSPGEFRYEMGPAEQIIAVRIDIDPHSGKKGGAEIETVTGTSAPGSPIFQRFPRARLALKRCLYVLQPNPNRPGPITAQRRGCLEPFGSHHPPRSNVGPLISRLQVAGWERPKNLPMHRTKMAVVWSSGFVTRLPQGHDEQPDIR